MFKYSESEIQEIVSLAESLKSITKACKIYNICPKTLSSYLKRFDINCTKWTSRKYYFHEDYFENINTQNKAYILGYIFADGCVSIRPNRHNSKCLSFNCIESDKEILEFILKELNIKKELQVTEPSSFISPLNGVEYGRKSQVRLGIDSAKIVDDLIKLGLNNNKTNLELKIPNIDENLISHFIRGYFDGDGSFCITKNNSKKLYINKNNETIYHSNGLYKYVVSFTSKTQSLLTDIKSIFKKGNISYSSRDCFVYSICGKSTTISFLDFIYKDSDFKLTRKYNKYAQLKSCELLENPEVDNQQPSLIEI